MLGSRLSCFTECYSWTNIFIVPQAVEALVDAYTWPGHGLNVGSAEDAQGKQEKRRLVELFQRSGGHVHCMCSLERNFECTGGLWRPESESLALLASP